MLKRIISILAITLILLTTFAQGYSNEYHVFADDVTNSWTQVTTNDQLAEAFRYYCKSRNLIIDSSALGALTRFTTNTFNGLCNTLGIDTTALQAQIKYTTDGNTGIKFLFSATGANAFNRIFAEFLQNNDLSVGDEVEDTNLVTGEWFQDYDGNGCYIFTTDNNLSVNSSYSKSVNDFIATYGTYYIYSDDFIKNLDFTSFTSPTIHLTSNISTNISFSRKQTSNQNSKIMVMNTSANNNEFNILYINSDILRADGYPIIIKDNENELYLAGYRNYYSGTSTYGLYCYVKITSGSTESGNVYITTNNNTINNNTYNNNTYTIINNNGDVYNYGDDDEPSPDTPVVPDDPTPDVPNPDIPSGNGWDDFTLPEMPNDWLIYGMEKKFPFDIPFNIMFALSLLNHEPVTPRFQGDIDLKVCTWHYDINLEPFNDIAVILRRFEVLAFIIGLALITKELINWG